MADLRGHAEKDGYAHGMIIRFDTPSDSLSTQDMLIVTGPNGGLLNMHPVGMQKGGTLLVLCRVKPDMRLQFKLVPVDSHTRRLEMEPHHIGLQKLGEF